MEEKVKQIIALIDMVISDTTVPKNIRKAATGAKEKLMTAEELNVRATAAIYALDEVAEDINMPMHARTQIWSIISALETAKTE
ncbi:UPF0147 family protein [Candidatus Micrarchaeota archaeon]|nr:UPF0147 family protein [Candidatus Micrarchaeota archaeon]